MSGEFPTTGDKLRKLINKSRAMPISFGYNPGTSDDDDEYLAAHPRKTPELLGKLALTEGAGTKSAFGTFVIDASELHLTCFRTLPQLAKKVKKYLKKNKITLNVVILDPDGNVLDSDVEVLEGWEKSLSEDGPDDGPSEAAAAAPQGKDGDVYIPAGFRTEPEPEPEPASEARSVPPGFRTEEEPEQAAIDPRDPALLALAARLRDAKARAKRMPAKFAKRLDGAIRAAASIVKDGDAGAGAKAVAEVEAALDRVPDPARTDPKLVAAQSRLSDAVDDLDGAAAEKLRTLLQRTADQIEAGQTDAALKGLRVAGRALQSVLASEARWKKAEPMVAPLAERAAKAGVAPVASAWGKAREAAEDGDWPAALAALPGVIAALRAAAA